MQSHKTERLIKISFAVLMLFVLSGLVGTVIWPITVTSFWAVGLGVVAALLFMASLTIRKYGIAKGLLSVAIVLMLTTLTFILNHYKGWPFGFVTYHDVLGWKVLGISWPIPIYWTFFTLASLLLTRPAKTEITDPKMPFSWAFDSAIMVMVLALIIEPLITASTVQVWSVPGGYFGIPLFSFVGWFVMAFVSGFATILIAKLWEVPSEEKPMTLLIAMLGMGLLGVVASIRFQMFLVGLICAILCSFVAFWIYKGRGAFKRIKKDEPAIASPSSVPEEEA